MSDDHLIQARVTIHKRLYAEHLRAQREPAVTYIGHRRRLTQDVLHHQRDERVAAGTCLYKAPTDTCTTTTERIVRSAMLRCATLRAASTTAGLSKRSLRIRGLPYRYGV